MPFTTAEVQKAGKAGLDFYLKNNPIDQVAQDKPLLAHLQKSKKAFPGAKEYIIEQLRTKYDSNGVWYSGSGDGVIGYNERGSLEQAKYAWYQYHDGMKISEAELRQNGIEVSDNVKPKSASEAEKIQLTNLWTERCEILHLGAQEKFDQALHLNGSGNTSQIVGLDGLLGTTSATGVVGGIDRATNAYWRHYTDLTLTVPTILVKMEKAWRECIRRGGKPDFILAGQDFIDAYMAAVTTSTAAGGIQRTMTAVKGGNDMDGAVSGVYYKGVEIKWDPSFDDDIAGLDTPTVPWSKRCYMLTSKHIKLRPASGADFITRNPERGREAYAVYTAVQWIGGLTMSQSNSHAVLAVA